MLFGSFADKATVNLRGDTHHEPARVGAFRQRFGDSFAGRNEIGEDVTHHVGEARESLDRVPASQDSDGSSATVATCSPSSTDHATR
jgi:hypothetical protein